MTTEAAHSHMFDRAIGAIQGKSIQDFCWRITIIAVWERIWTLSKFD
jgi:hypothetical protein